MDFNRYEARRAGQPVALTPIEYRLLAALVRSGGRVLTVDQIIDEVWGKGIALTERVVYTHVNKLGRRSSPTLPTPSSSSACAAWDTGWVADARRVFPTLARQRRWLPRWRDNLVRAAART